MTHSTHSLASLLRGGLQTLEHRRRNGAVPEDPDYLLLAQHPIRPALPVRKLTLKLLHPTNGPLIATLPARRSLTTWVS